MGKGAGQSSGWNNDDDDWAPLETPVPRPQSKVTSSGAEFFDALADPLPSRDTPFSKMAAAKPKTEDTVQTSRHKTPPPPVNPSIFQPKNGGSVGSTGGWGDDWTEDTTHKQQSQVSVA